MSERILVPLDGSDPGEAALDYLAALLAKLAPGKGPIVYLLHIVTTLTHEIDVHGDGAGIVFVPNSDEEMRTLESESRRYLEKIAGRISPAAAEVRAVVRRGANPAEEIIRVEDELESDLVVMSTHGRSGISRWAFGSVTEKVLRAGSVPVLMVRAAKNA